MATLAEDLTADVQDADAKLVSLTGRISALDPATSTKKRMCMLQQHAALTQFRKISQALLGVEQNNG